MGGWWRLDLWSALVGLALTVVGLVTLVVLRRPAAALIRGIRKQLQEWRRQLFSGVEGRYRAEVIRESQGRHLGAGAARLDQVFVSPRFLRTLPEPDLAEEAILPRSQLSYLWPELAARVAVEPPAAMSLGQAARSVQRAALIGPSGAGKSTTLAFLALSCADSSDLGDLALAPNILPLHAHLAELQLRSRRDGRASGIEQPLLEAVQRRAGPVATDRLPGALRLALEEGRALVLLDGWDELAPHERPPFTRWIGELMTRFPANQFFVSAPSTGHGPLVDLGLIPLFMLSWDMSDVTRIARLWASALEATLPTVRERQRSGAAQIPALDFWQAGLTPLDTTLNLWLMLAGEIPPIESALRYGASIHHLLAPFGKGSVNWALEVGHQVLGDLAQQLDQAETRIASYTQLEEAVHLVLSRRDDAGGRAAQECLRVLADLGGLLTRWGDSRLCFASPILFDYFWAYRVVAGQDSAAAEARSGNPEWSQALGFYAELAPAGPLIETALSVPTDLLQEGLFQAAEWLSDAAAQEKWVRPILIRLGKLMIDGSAPLALRERAAAALVGTQDSGVGYLLRQAMAAPDPALRATAAPGLGALATELPGRPGDNRALETLIQGLSDDSVDVQRAAIHALAATRSEASEKALLRTLLEADPSIRQVAAEAMARMGDWGHQVIREALTSDEVLVRRAAVAGLALVDEPWVNDTLDHLQRNDTEWIVRSAAEELLQQRQGQAATHTIEPVQADQLAWLIRWAAVRGEGVPGGPAAAAVLQRVLRDGEPDTARAAAARSLGDLCQPRFLQPLMVALRDPSRSVREASFFALASISRSWNERLTLAREGQTD